MALASKDLALPEYKYKEIQVSTGGEVKVQKGPIDSDSNFQLKLGDKLSVDVRTVGAGLKEYVEEAFEGKITIGDVTPESFKELMVLLSNAAKTDKEQEKTQAYMLSVENALREGQRIEDLTDTKKIVAPNGNKPVSTYPLYMWYLIMNTTAEVLPIPLPAVDQASVTPVPQEPVEPAEQ